MFTLVFTLNEGVRPGYYPVLPGNVTVVDTEHKYVPTAVINGAVLLEEPTVTSSSTTTTTTTTTSTTTSKTTASTTTTTETTPLQPEDYDLGDVNEDGKIDAKDASSILAYYALVSTSSADIPTMKEFMAPKQK